jgi:sugar (glycoside-pentoside-hexuronide) transporter
MEPKNDLQTTKKERVSYGVYFLGQCTFYGIVSSYLQIFFTDIAIPAATVGVIFLVARIWDAINDPLFGILVDRVHLKRGKYKPWLKLSSFLIPVFTIAMFAIPSGMPGGIKLALASTLYICWGMSYTICDIPIFSVVTAMTGNTNERNRIISYGRIAMFGGSIFIGALMPILYPAIGWFPAVTLFSILGFAAMVPLGYLVKERHVQESAQAPTIGLILQTVAKNRYLMTFFIASIIGSLTNTAIVVGGYFAIYNLGGPQMMIYLNILPLLPVIVLAMLTPMLARKVDKFILYLGSIGINIIFSIILFIVGYSRLPIFLALYTIRTIALYYGGVVGSMFYVDCAEYGLYKTGRNAVAVTMSLSTFTTKVLSAVSGALAMFILGSVGFVTGEGAVQPETVTRALWIMLSILPVIGTLFSFFILLMGYKLKEKDVQIMARINNHEISEEEGKSLLSRQY